MSAHPMTRSFDTIPTESDRPAELQKPAAQIMSVCPFCGAIAEKCEGPCPRCKMENSALTRQATRARIGPWYVMQSRNPSAPGMKCNTLLALIRKGQITPRSVIRGPTTFQLWRFAARVKGISREFGLCYSCGAELQRTSTFCPRCSRSQELPPNPDVLLENETQQTKQAVYRELSPAAAPSENTMPPQISERAPVRAASPVESLAPEPEPLRATRPPTQIPSAAETMAELAEIPSPHNAPASLQSRPKQRPQEGVLTPRELAAAFSLQYDPMMDAPGVRPRRRGKKGLLAAAIVLLAVGGGASTFYFSPALRQSFIAWIQDSSPASAAAPDQSQAPKPMPDRTPDWMMTVPNDPPPITATSKQNSSNLVASNNPSNGSSNNPSNNQSNNPQSNSTQPPPVPHTAPPSAPPVTPVSNDAAPTLDTPVVTATPTVDPRTRDAADATAKLRQSDASDLDHLAMDLRGNGLDAEHRQDFLSAQYYYQQVETLPRDHWPNDIDLLLKNVQRQLAGANNNP